MAPKIVGVVVAFFQSLHYVHSHFRASLVSGSSYCVKFLSKFFDFCPKAIVNILALLEIASFVFLFLVLEFLLHKFFLILVEFNAIFFVFLLNVAIYLIVFFLVLVFMLTELFFLVLG
jgi:hypothetical protein